MAKINKQTRKKFVELVESYNETKKRLSELKKLEEQANKEIKEFMESHNLTSFDAETVSVTYYEQDKTTMDEEGLITLFQTVAAFKKINKKANIVEVVPRINSRNLTDAIYNDMFTEKQRLEMDKYKIEKTIPAIRLKKLEVDDV